MEQRVPTALGDTVGNAFATALTKAPQIGFSRVEQPAPLRSMQTQQFNSMPVGGDPSPSYPTNTYPIITMPGIANEVINNAPATVTYLVYLATERYAPTITGAGGIMPLEQTEDLATVVEQWEANPHLPTKRPDRGRAFQSSINRHMAVVEQTQVASVVEVVLQDLTTPYGIFFMKLALVQLGLGLGQFFMLAALRAIMTTAETIDINMNFIFNTTEEGVTLPDIVGPEAALFGLFNKAEKPVERLMSEIGERAVRQNRPSVPDSLIMSRAVARSTYIRAEYNDFFRAGPGGPASLRLTMEDAFTAHGGTYRIVIVDAQAVSKAGPPQLLTRTRRYGEYVTFTPVLDGEYPKWIEIYSSMKDRTPHRITLVDALRNCDIWDEGTDELRDMSGATPLSGYVWPTPDPVAGRPLDYTPNAYVSIFHDPLTGKPVQDLFDMWANGALPSSYFKKLADADAQKIATSTNVPYRTSGGPFPSHPTRQAQIHSSLTGQWDRVEVGGQRKLKLADDRFKDAYLLKSGMLKVDGAGIIRGTESNGGAKRVLALLANMKPLNADHEESLGHICSGLAQIPLTADTEATMGHIGAFVDGLISHGVVSGEITNMEHSPLKPASEVARVVSTLVGAKDIGAMTGTTAYNRYTRAFNLLPGALYGGIRPLRSTFITMAENGLPLPFTMAIIRPRMMVNTESVFTCLSQMQRLQYRMPVCTWGIDATQQSKVLMYSIQVGTVITPLAKNYMQHWPDVYVSSLGHGWSHTWMHYGKPGGHMIAIAEPLGTPLDDLEVISLYGRMADVPRLQKLGLTMHKDYEYKQMYWNRMYIQAGFGYANEPTNVQSERQIAYGTSQDDDSLICWRGYSQHPNSVAGKTDIRPCAGPFAGFVNSNPTFPFGLQEMLKHSDGPMLAVRTAAAH